MMLPLGSPLPVVGRKEMPVLFHEPYVETGFRPCHQPWKNYVLSIFQWHNELMNVWTHLIALIVCSIRGLMWWYEFDLVTDPYMWPLAVGVTTIIILYSCSSGAHLFCNRSELTHYTCFMCDYAGIGLYGFGSTMLHYWYCLHEDFLGTLSHQLGVPIGALLGVTVCLCCSISKTKYKRPYPFARRIWQISSVLSIYVWLIFPIWYKIWLYVHNGEWESSFAHHLRQMIWFTMAGFFFGTDIPQRFFPGRFDLLGHSHQIFHVCIFMTTYEQMNALYLEITDGSKVIHRMEAPTLLNTWGALSFVIVANAIVVVFFHLSVLQKLEIEHRKKTDIDPKDASQHIKAGHLLGMNGACCASGQSDLCQSQEKVQDSVKITETHCSTDDEDLSSLPLKQNLQDDLVKGEDIVVMEPVSNDEKTFVHFTGNIPEETSANNEPSLGSPANKNIVSEASEPANPLIVGIEKDMVNGSAVAPDQFASDQKSLCSDSESSNGVGSKGLKEVNKAEMNSVSAT